MSAVEIFQGLLIIATVATVGCLFYAWYHMGIKPDLQAWRAMRQRTQRKLA